MNWPSLCFSWNVKVDGGFKFPRSTVKIGLFPIIFSGKPLKKGCSEFFSWLQTRLRSNSNLSVDQSALD